MPEYDSAADTLRHSRRVGELLGDVITELVHRSYRHDLSKTQPLEKETFDRVTPRLRDLTYGTPEYAAAVADMGEALAHHYAHNAHHPKHHNDGIAGMTLVDLVEMLADWRAATERTADGDLARSLEIQRRRFALDPQLAAILRTTADKFGWLTTAGGHR